MQVCGKAFYYKDPLRAFFLSAGVPSELYDRFAGGGESKYQIARHVLSELERLGEDGYLVQRRIVTELCKLRDVRDKAVEDRNAGFDALRWLKELAVLHDIEVQEDRMRADAKTEEARRKQAAIAARAQKMEELRRVFAAMVINPEAPQRRGYALEDLLAELFEAHEIPYRRAYRTGVEQIDGSFEYGGFDYLVEARWRMNPPTAQELGAFKSKVDKKLSSTRGLFVSVVGFRPEVVADLARGPSNNIMLMCGHDLTLILEGQVSLRDALDLKIDKAAQEGIIYYPVSARFP